MIPVKDQDLFGGQLLFWHLSIESFDADNQPFHGSVQMMPITLTSTAATPFSYT